MNSHLYAERIGDRQGTSGVPLDEVVERVTAGQLIVLRGCLQALGYFDPIQSIIRDVLQKHIGPERAEAIMGAGIQWLHRFVKSGELTGIAKQLQAELAELSMMMMKRVARELLNVRSDAYAEEARNVRIFVPQDSWYIGREDYLEFERERSRGKLTLHGPHTDLWGYHPLNVINLWTAIGPVLPENGMSIWPEFFGRIPPMGEWHVSRKDQVLGKPLGVSLDAGDALMFHIGHLHGSRINQTEQTRFVLSARFTVGPPVLFDKPWYSYMSLDDIPDKIGAVTPPCAVATERPAVPPENIDTSDRLPASVAPVCDLASESLVFESHALALGEVRPLNSHYCVARTSDGVVAFSRRCPHEGGDLAAGYIEGAAIHCPDHHLSVDLRTGRSPCRSLPAITVFPATEVNGSVRVPAIAAGAASGSG